MNCRFVSQVKKKKMASTPEMEFEWPFCLQNVTEAVKRQAFNYTSWAGLIDRNEKNNENEKEDMKDKSGENLFPNEHPYICA